MRVSQLPILKRLVPSTRHRLARLMWGGNRGVIRRDGALFGVDLAHWADKTLLTRGAFERAQTAYLIEEIEARGCDTFLDIGANMGAYSIFVALQTDCPRIIAFEPDQRSYTKLCKNVALNRLSERIELHAVAVSNINGTVPFIPGPDHFDAVSKVGVDAQSKPVPAVRLDDLLSLSGHAIALKIDIEGHELTALEGMRVLLRENECFMQVECFDENLARFTEAMTVLGYRQIYAIGIDRYFSK